MTDSISFGPIPSRRLGRSLGVNNIPPKACSYSCLYCQVGPTPQREIEPRDFYPPERILADVTSRLQAAERSGEAVDYLTFVPDGEPTLDRNLGETIRLLRPLGVKIAVITNASLIWREDVRECLAAADWISVKVDSVEGAVWRRINQPHPSLELSRILEGIRLFAEVYSGVLNTETMLVEGVNDDASKMAAQGEYLAQLNPARAYLAIPLRPTAEQGIRPPSEQRINAVFQALSPYLPQLECLIGYEGNAFASTGNVAEDLLSITAVHPMREEAVRALLEKTGGDWEIVISLVEQGRLKTAEYQGRRFYMRVLPSVEEGTVNQA